MTVDALKKIAAKPVTGVRSSVRLPALFFPTGVFAA
jgi:hypothetical protein